MTVNDLVLILTATMPSNDSGKNNQCSEAILEVQKEDELWLMSN